MHPATKAALLAHVLRWRFSWSRHDVDWRAPGLPANPRFVTAREAVGLIPDRACVMSSGLAGNMRCSILYWAVREEFERSGHPRGLTWVAAGGMGGRGRIPGTLEEVGLDGLVVRHVSGHLETVRSLLELAEAGRCELHTLPQGVLAQAVEAQARGEDSFFSRVGVGTFVDPRVGHGSLVVPGRGRSLVVPEADGLCYRVPRIEVALFLATGADAQGNVYMDNASVITECRESALAAKRHGGKVIVSVAGLVDAQPGRAFLAASEVDAIVVNPRNEQAGSYPQLHFLPALSPGHEVDLRDAEERLEFINRLVGVAPRRTPAEAALARQAATLFTRTAGPGAHVCVGVGLPEEVSRLIHAGGLLGDVTFLVETGAWGGLPAPGIFFGAAIRPQKFLSSAEMFRYLERHLEVAVLGFLQADGRGDVNASRRGPGPRDYVGPGGFIDVSSAARTVIFVGSFRHHARLAVEGGKLRYLERGGPRFVGKVAEVTFSGAEALRRGQRVFFVTDAATFRLTPLGLELLELAPGLDLDADLLAGSEARLVAPQAPIARTPEPVITGDGFRLEWQPGWL